MPSDFFELSIIGGIESDRYLSCESIIDTFSLGSDSIGSRLSIFNEPIFHKRDNPPLQRPKREDIFDFKRALIRNERNYPASLNNRISSTSRSEEGKYSIRERLSGWFSRHSMPAPIQRGIVGLGNIRTERQERRRIRAFHNGLLNWNLPGAGQNLVGRTFARQTSQFENGHPFFQELNRRDLSEFDYHGAYPLAFVTFDHFNHFVAPEFPLPSYREALKRPSVPKYSGMIEDIKEYDSPPRYEDIFKNLL